MSPADLIANVVAVLHIGYFLFVAGGSASIVVGAVKRWEWIRNPWFRLSHITAVYIVLIEGLFKIQCPLNTIEWTLRSTSSSVAESSPKVGRFLDYLLFHTIPVRALDTLYWSLGVILVVLLFVVQPRFRKSATQQTAKE